jgi:hypothetical protein
MSAVLFVVAAIYHITLKGLQVQLRFLNLGIEFLSETRGEIPATDRLVEIN